MAIFFTCGGQVVLANMAFLQGYFSKALESALVVEVLATIKTWVDEG